MTSLLDRELVFVTGKGGVGKTTVSLALALTAAARGRRVVLVEVGGQDRVPRALRRAAPQGEEVRLLDGVWWQGVDPTRALEEWAGRVIGSRRLLQPALRSRAFGGFVDAAPGAKELVTIAKAWELGRAPAERWVKGSAHYDLVVVDAPASGHGVGMLQTPRTFADIARVGPIAGQARRVQRLLEDPVRSAVVAVCQPAEMPVAETLELGPRVHRAVGRGVDLVVCNALLSRRFSGEEIGVLAGADGAVPGVVLEALAERAERAAMQEEQLGRLREGVGAPVATLPFVAGPALSLDEVRGLATELEAALG
jgi:anion-transporting  ArsA/GET3 family ATPase